VEITLVNPPTISLTSPAPNATFTAPANINLQAQASSVDGTVANVKFFRGSTLIATVTSAPFVFAWNGVGQGSYSLTAQVTDSYGITVSSTAVPITVNVGGPQVYFIQVDHLNAPRLVANAAGTTVWQWNQGEPFASDPANENPSGVGAFELPLRLAGQYLDKETGLHYNYFRDYSPALGRYGESDPIGLRGGLNTYAYVRGKPILFSDPLGLFNPVKGAVGTANMAKGAMQLESGAAGLATGTPLGIGLGLYRLTTGATSMGRGLQQLCESLDEDFSDASLKNLWGLAPFGQAIDDPWEPSAYDFYKDKIQNLPKNWLQILIELGTVF
jgi:RHS repeat-associated protein